MDNSLQIIQFWMQVTACILLATAFISILLHKKHHKDPHFLFLLWILLLLLFFANNLWNSLHHSSSPYTYAYPLSFLEWILHAFIARFLLPETKRRFLDYLVIASASVSLTTYIAIEFQQQDIQLPTIHTGITGVLALIIIAREVQKNNFYILQSPLFWMAIGSFFYACMFLLVQCIAPFLALPRTSMAETNILLLFFNIVRFALYDVAALLGENPKSSRQ